MPWFRHLQKEVRLYLLAMACSGCLSAQVVGASISGVVHDETGSALPQANVTITSSETGAERKTLSDSAGRYNAISIAVGQYQVTVTKSGFAAQVKTGINLVVGETATVDFTLPVGEVRQVVTVEETSAAVNLSTQQTSGLVNERQVKELPLNGRSYDGLITLNPAIVNYTSQRSGGIGTSNSAMGNMFAASGHRRRKISSF